MSSQEFENDKNCLQQKKRLSSTMTHLMSQEEVSRLETTFLKLKDLTSETPTAIRNLVLILSNHKRKDSSKQIQPKHST